MRPRIRGHALSALMGKSRSGQARGLYVAAWSLFILSRQAGSFLELEVVSLLLTSAAVGVLVARWWVLALPLAAASWMLTPLPYEGGEADVGVALAGGIGFLNNR